MQSKHANVLNDLGGLNYGSSPGVRQSVTSEAKRVILEQEEQIDALLAAFAAILERSAGNLYSTDQETGETFDAIARAAIAKATGTPVA